MKGRGAPSGLLWIATPNNSSMKDSMKAVGGVPSALSGGRGDAHTHAASSPPLEGSGTRVCAAISVARRQQKVERS
ncbi:hypothetical protein EYF80_046595 [Liparis tanakae]|uniref:Uncharacterized protein n=1 Tax=Liparis tanakae TaxID=230148 RepID=A0A4Z2FPS5_9TELE|nr:hypothetical protein EYF80_046595 [Liparis tanakae]